MVDRGLPAEPPTAATPPAAPLQGLALWITGASRWIGATLARGLAAAGARVALTARPSAQLDEVAGDISKAGGEVLLLPASVADHAETMEVAGELGRRWQHLDGLVNAAGVSPSFASAETVTPDDWRQVIETNLTGTFLCTKAAFPMMRERGGTLVNITSVHGRVAHRRLSAYCASKGGVEMLTRALALDCVRFGIRINALAPAYFETPLTEGLRQSERWRTALLDRRPMGRFGHPDELIAATSFLLSPASSYVTGSTVVVDGGWTAA